MNSEETITEIRTLLDIHPDDELKLVANWGGVGDNMEFHETRNHLIALIHTSNVLKEQQKEELGTRIDYKTIKIRDLELSLDKKIEELCTYCLHEVENVVSNISRLRP